MKRLSEAWRLKHYAHTAKASLHDGMNYANERTNERTKPLAIDLFCGLGGWTEGLLAEGYRVIGFDIERHVYGEHCYTAQLVLQDVLTIHGSQFKDAALIVASPPCQEYSYMAMPWTRAKQIAAEYCSGVRDVAQLTALFDACFRIQREACEAAGRHIPMVVENVRGAIPWIGRSRWHFGSFHLWGDVPALMPMACKAVNRPGRSMSRGAPQWSTHHQTADIVNEGVKWTTDFAERGVKGFTPHGQPLGQNVLGRKHGSKSSARKQASAMIAKIPLTLSRWVAKAWYPV